MNHQNCEAYSTGKKKAEHSTVKGDTLTINIKDFEKIELVSADGKLLKFIDISRYGGIAKFS